MRLFVIGEQRFATHALPPQGELVLGSAAHCDVAIDDPSVAPQHARICLGPPLSIEDLGSGRPTQIGEQQLPPGQRAGFSVGEPVQLGRVLVLLERRRDAPPRRILSRDYFEQRIEEECYRAERSRTVFSVLRVEVRPEAGEAAEAILADSLRLVDVIAALGRGEYGVLLCETPPVGVEVVLARLRERMRAAGVETSLNVAFYPRDGHDAFSLLARSPRARAGTEADLLEHSPAMLKLRRMVERVAASDISVLILGETGVGKERMAEEIHRRSPRAHKPLVRLNCAALSDSLLESELFGHERGAFTGALERKHGLLESAQGGTVFLDEVGDMPPATQVKLLRVLEERRVRRVGGIESLEIDVRFVSATNRDLEQAVARGAFREDLFFRLNGMTFVIPPLRERPSEIDELAHYFLADACKRYGGRPPPAITPQALQLLRGYPWPGNIRELRSVMERAAVLCEAGELLPAHLPEERMRAHFARRDARPFAEHPAPLAGANLPEEDRRRKEEILALLREHRGNVTAVARAMSKARFQVQRWLKRYRIDAAAFR